MKTNPWIFEQNLSFELAWETKGTKSYRRAFNRLAEAIGGHNACKTAAYWDETSILPVSPSEAVFCTCYGVWPMDE